MPWHRHWLQNCASQFRGAVPNFAEGPMGGWEDGGGRAFAQRLVGSFCFFGNLVGPLLLVLVGTWKGKGETFKGGGFTNRLLTLHVVKTSGDCDVHWGYDFSVLPHGHMIVAISWRLARSPGGRWLRSLPKAPLCAHRAHIARLGARLTIRPSHPLLGCYADMSLLCDFPLWFPLKPTKGHSQRRHTNTHVNSNTSTSKSSGTS